jgi:hypothetical protein
MANNFNRYFSKIAEGISSDLPSEPDEQYYLNPTTDYHLSLENCKPTRSPETLLRIATTGAEASSIVNSLKNTTSVGHNHLKVSSMITPITYIVNKFLANGVFSDDP